MATPSNESAKPCVICGKPANPQLKPFCSRRCADVDLNRWLSGAYKVPTNEEPDEEQQAPPAQRRDDME